jgi:hypothetical protein
MPVALGVALEQVQTWVRRGFEFLILTAVLLLVMASVAAAFGLLPWLELAASYGGTPVPQAGTWVQLGLTGLMLALVFYLPANLRMARLERSHRNFALGIEDVTRAYRSAHAADRTGVFALSGEFDSMRARFEHLRRHPDLGHLEPEILQLAAAMSFVSRDLARTYSEDKVARARTFLHQRQEEIHEVTDRIAAARQTCDELRRWLTDIEVDERKAQQQIHRLEADLKEILPTLGYDFDIDATASDAASPGNVVPMNKPAK